MFIKVYPANLHILNYINISKLLLRRLGGKDMYKKSFYNFEIETEGEALLL